MNVAPGEHVPSGGQPVMFAGEVGATFSVNCCSTVPLELVAIIPQGKLWPVWRSALIQKFGPLSGDVQVPLIVAVPLWLSVKLRPPNGRLGSAESAGVGLPVATTVKLVGTPAVRLNEFGETIAS